MRAARTLSPPGWVTSLAEVPADQYMHVLPHLQRRARRRHLLRYLMARMRAVDLVFNFKLQAEVVGDALSGL